MLTGYSDNIKPEVKVEENNNKLEQEFNSDIKPIDATSSPDGINTSVVCRPSSDSNLNNADLSNDDSANGVSDEQRIIQIEKVLSGLTIDKAQYLLRNVNRGLMSKSLVSA